MTIKPKGKRGKIRMKYTIERLVVERHDVPSCPSLDGHVKDIRVERIAEIDCDADFRQDDVIVIDGRQYVVKTRICMVAEPAMMLACAPPGARELERIVLRVVPYTGKQLRRHGNDAWVETIPLFPPRNKSETGGDENADR